LGALPTSTGRLSRNLSGATYLAVSCDRGFGSAAISSSVNRELALDEALIGGAGDRDGDSSDQSPE
jgi:hypothetical protein